MDNIRPECVICKELLWQNPTTELAEVSSALNREIKTTDVVQLVCKHKFHSECIERWAKDNPRCPVGRRLITTLPRSSENLHRALLKSIEDHQIDDAREILSTGVVDLGELSFRDQENLLALSLTHEQWDVSAELLRVGMTTANPEAQNNLGRMYQNGLGVEQNYGEAMRWYLNAAHQGHAAARSNLGWMYLNGLGVEKSKIKAVYCYHRAATMGHAAAQNIVGWMYQNGFGFAQNYQKAMVWYHRAADQQHPAAQNSLGWMYQNGLGVEQNYQEAMRWYQKSADQGHASGQNNVGWMHHNGLGVGQSFQEALVWYHKAADQGHSVAQNNVRLMYQFLL